MKRSLFFVLALTVAATALAARRPLYRIVLRNGASCSHQLLTMDEPVARGGVLVFHEYPKGTLAGVPREQVAGMASAGLKASVDEATVTHGPAGRPQRLPGDSQVIGDPGRLGGSQLR